MNKKWSGSAVYAATETRVNVTKALTETQVIRRVSGTVSHVSATFPFTDSWNFVLCQLCGYSKILFAKTKFCKLKQRSESIGIIIVVYFKA